MTLCGNTLPCWKDRVTSCGHTRSRVSESLCGWLATGERGESMRYTKSFSV